jgi:lipopolysaccharide export system protein LptA
MLVKRKNQALLLSTLFVAMQCLPPLSAVAQPKTASAAAPAAPGVDPAAAPGSGPIDIQAHEQEFTGDHVIAKGNVKVLYKDTVILAPLATLYRDLASGQPQKAIFNGHPYLTQGANKIDADQLIFEMTTSKIFADGHAHSEVVNNDPVAEPPTAKKKGGGNNDPNAFATSSGPAPTTKGGMVANGKGGFEWPTQESDRKKAQTQKQGIKQEQTEKLAQKASKDSANESRSTSESTTDLANNSTKDATKESPDGQPGADGAAPENKPVMVSRGPLSGGSTAGGAGDSDAPTKIVTDSQRQEYDRDSGRFEAFGNVKVLAGDIHVTADHLKLAYGIDHRPEAAIFDGHVNAIQDKNNTASDFMTYFLITKRLQASGHVRSKVIQEKQEAKPIPKKQEEGVIKPISNVITPDASSKEKPHNVLALNGLMSSESKAPIIIIADSQDYNKETGRLDAIGNAKIFFEDTVGIGPKVILMKNADGQAERIIFVGRSQVTQKGKRWIGDRVTIMVADHRIIAEGNTKAIFLQKKEGGAPGAAPLAPLEDNTRLAGKTPQVISATPAKSQAETSTQAQVTDPNNRQLSASKVNRPE